MKIDDDETVKRIADLKSISSRGNFAHNENSNEQGYCVQKSGNTYLVDIHDTWSTMKIKFTVLHTRIHSGQSIRITGNLPELGNWNKVNPISL